MTKDQAILELENKGVEFDKTASSKEIKALLADVIKNEELKENSDVEDNSESETLDPIIKTEEKEETIDLDKVEPVKTEEIQDQEEKETEEVKPNYSKVKRSDTGWETKDGKKFTSVHIAAAHAGTLE